MGNWDEEMVELGGLWLSKTGKSWTGTIDHEKLANAKPPFRVMLLKNHRRVEGDNKPAFRLILNTSQPRGDFRAEQEEDRETRRPPTDEDLL